MYQNVGSKCRFYIDYLTEWHEQGLIENITYQSQQNLSTKFNGSLFGLDPVINAMLDVEFTTSSPNNVYTIYINFKNTLSKRMIESINYLSFLGHELNVDNHSLIANWQVFDRTETMVRVRCLNAAGEEVGTISPSRHAISYEIINFDTSQEFGTATEYGFSKFPEQGFSMTEATYEGADEDKIQTIALDIGVYDVTMNQFIPFDFIGQTGVLALGHYYDLRSPDLALTMTYEYDGYDLQESTSGRTFKYTKYLGAPNWGKLHPWVVGESERYAYAVKKRGRKNWKLNFRHIQDSDLFPSNMGTSTYYNSNQVSSEHAALLDNSDSNNSSVLGYKDEHTAFNTRNFSREYDIFAENNYDIIRDRWRFTIEDDDSFVAKVLNYVGNGERFIFQPDFESTQQSDFCIGTLDQKKLSMKQVSHHVYDISLKVRETW